MRPTQHSSNNRVIGAPDGWDQGGMACSALAITNVNYEGAPGMLSFWRPTPQELAELNAGGLVCLSIIGQNMPPVAIGVEMTP